MVSVQQSAMKKMKPGFGPVPGFVPEL